MSNIYIYSWKKYIYVLVYYNILTPLSRINCAVNAPEFKLAGFNHMYIYTLFVLMALSCERIVKLLNVLCCNFTPPVKG